ncbi:hypothetical protein ACFQE0_26125 [Methylobacterium komagatae]|uniref:Tim44-like domain-containing protein n=1 Tax=Methylobacterium komagatae TaxID=374425 RepID=A0ABW2BTR2_9HYPH
MDTVLSRIEPAEIARALWANDEVKAAFMDCLADRWCEGGIDDKDRRAFLARVQEAVHGAALDRLAKQMAEAEYELTRRAHHVDEVWRINETLREKDVRVLRSVRGDDGERTTQMVLLQFDDRCHAVRKDDGTAVLGDFQIGGRSWTEAREFWRAEVLKRFPTPVASAE